MPVIIEWIIGVLRAGEHTITHGDPYTFSATVIRRGDVVEIVGATGTIPRGGLRDLKKALQAVGVTHIVWDRKRPDGYRHIETSTDDSAP